MEKIHTEYLYENTVAAHTNEYLWPNVEAILQNRFAAIPSADPQVFDLGCGNGSFLRRLQQLGIPARGVDPSTSGIAHARTQSPAIFVEEGSAYDDLAGKYGTFRCVVCLEVVEHLYSPRVFAKTLYDLVEPGGFAIVSTPYHSYAKNLVLALTGKFDAHFTALWDHGHIKFWSVRTLTELLREAGFDSIEFEFAGRTPILAKSMIAIVKKPLGQQYS